MNIDCFGCFYLLHYVSFLPVMAAAVQAVQYKTRVSLTLITFSCELSMISSIVGTWCGFFFPALILPNILHKIFLFSTLFHFYIVFIFRCHLQYQCQRGFCSQETPTMFCTYIGVLLLKRKCMSRCKCNVLCYIFLKRLLRYVTQYLIFITF